jgi:hypothetical protein
VARALGRLAEELGAAAAVLDYGGGFVPRADTDVEAGVDAGRDAAWAVKKAWRTREGRRGRGR